MLKNYNEILHLHEKMTTARLVLRRADSLDAADLLEIAADPQALEYLVWEGCDSIDDMRIGIYDFHLSRPGVWIIDLNGKAIGTIDIRLDHNNDKAAFGFVINREYWGRGYATEALKAVLALCFDGLQLNRVESQHYVGNEGSGRVMAKCGMKYEGTQIQGQKIKGVFRDIVLYGITRGQYAALL